MSKEITGCQDNHGAVRVALVNFMKHDGCAQEFARQLFGHSTQHSAVACISAYVEESNMDQCAWGSEKEIFAAATLLQTDICIFSYFGKSRKWQTHRPLFNNRHCLTPGDGKIYLYHTESADHYDRVVPYLA